LMRTILWGSMQPALTLAEQVKRAGPPEEGERGLVGVVHEVALEERLLDGDAVGAILQGRPQELLVAGGGADVPAALVDLHVQHGTAHWTLAWVLATLAFK
jgi:hypothetical protein